MTLAADIATIRDNLVAELKAETTRRAALTAAGNPPPTSYQVGGKQVHWNEYLAEMRQQIEFYNALAITLAEPYEEVTRGYT